MPPLLKSNITVYFVIGEPPSDVGLPIVTFILTQSDHVEFSSLVIAGAPGAPFVVTDPEGADAPEVRPAAFVAVTVNV